MPQDDHKSDLLRLTAEIVAAHVSHNSVSSDALPNLIREVYRSLKDEPDEQKKKHSKTGTGGESRKIGVPRVYNLP